MARRMVAGGVDILQIRAKGFLAPDILALAAQVRPITEPAGVPLIINDHPWLVPSAGADGAHIGQDDGPLAAARAKAGAGKIVGRSTHSLDQARAARDEGADYLGFGPLFATPTKPDYRPIGLDEIARVHAEITDRPIFCIGGIKLENLPEVIAAGARRVVIVSGILRADDVTAYTRDRRRSAARRPDPPSRHPLKTRAVLSVRDLRVVRGGRGDPRRHFLARGARRALGHPRRERLRQNVAPQRADRVPHAQRRDRRSARRGVWPHGLARTAQARRSGQ